MKFFLFWPLLNIHQLTLCYWIIHKERMGDVRTNSISRKKKKKKLKPVPSGSVVSFIQTLMFSIAFLAPAPCCFSSSASFLPPGEEGSPALETLRVRLTVCSLRSSGCFNNYWRHLDQLEGCFTIFQGLAQVQDLGMQIERFVTS